MKIRMLLILIIVAGVGVLFSDINLGLGIDLPGTYHTKSNSSEGDTDTNIGFEAFGEYLMPYQKLDNGMLSWGFGAGYLFPRGWDFEYNIFDEQSFGFIPIYLVGQYSINMQNNMKYYGKLKAGYDLFYGNNAYTQNAELSGGIYTGISGGVLLGSNVFFELIYQQNRGKNSWEYHDEYYDSEDTTNITLSHLSFLFGIQFK